MGIKCPLVQVLRYFYRVNLACMYTDLHNYMTLADIHMYNMHNAITPTKERKSNANISKSFAK